MNTEIDNLIQSVRDGKDLTQDQTAHVFSDLMGGQLAGNQIDALLVALADKGETVDEIVGAARVMRKHAVHIPCDNPDAIDTCGTGGDGISTFNVSTAAAIVAAAAGACVAKHGNRSNTRASGSAEVLSQLGVDIEADTDVVARCLRDVGIAFLHAAKLHPAMRHAVESRRRLARPTIFNLLGPLTNPAGVTRQVIGVPRPDLTKKIAEALRELGAVHAMVVHGSVAAEAHQGLCDFTVTGESAYVELREGTMKARTVTPEEVGLSAGSLEALRIDSPAASADAVRVILAGERGPRRDHTLLNTAAALVVAGISSDLKEGVNRGAEAIDSGAAARTLDRWIATSRGAA